MPSPDALADQIARHIDPNAVRLDREDGAVVYTSNARVAEIYYTKGYRPHVVKHVYRPPTLTVCGVGHGDPHIRRRRYKKP